MDPLLSLPDALGRKVLSEFLSVKSIAMLDRAYQSHSQREMYLTLLKGSRFSTHPLIQHTEEKLIGYFEWLGRRSCSASIIVLPVKTSETLASKLSQRTLSCCPQLTEIDFTPIFSQKDRPCSLVALILPRCRCILKLTMSLPSGTSAKILWDVAQSCPLLQTMYLSISSSALFVPYETKSSLVFPTLQELTLYGFHLKVEFFDTLVGATPELQEALLGDSSLDPPARPLHHTWTKLTKFEAPRHMSEEAVLFLLQHNPDLIHLHIECSSTDVNDATARCIATHCTKLVDLSLRTSMCGDEGMRILLQQCTNLTHLDLRDSLYYKTPTYQAIAANCANLVNLNITDCPIQNADLTAIVNGCPNLTRIEFSDYSRIRGYDPVFRAITDLLNSRKILWFCSEPEIFSSHNNNVSYSPPEHDDYGGYSDDDFYGNM